MSKNSKDTNRSPSTEDILHEHIANTYFRKTEPEKEKIPDLPNPKKVRKPLFLIVSIACILSVICIPVVYNNYSQYAKERILRSENISLTPRGIFDQLLISRLEYGGYAKGRCKFIDNALVLSTLKKYNQADAGFNFKFPMDLTDRNLTITAKGNRGGEALTIVARDTNNRSFKIRDLYLTSNWKTDTISFDAVRNDIDITRITHLRFEFGRVGESSKLMDSLVDITIFIKSIQITKGAKI